MNLSAIVVPRGRLPRNIPKEGHHHPPAGVRRMASTSTPPKRDIFDIGPIRSKSRNSLDLGQSPQFRAYPGRPGFAWPFNKSGNIETTTSKVSLDRHSSKSSQTGASQFRVVGRGGSGSKMRQISLSNPILVLDTDKSSLRQQPLEEKPKFYRPGGRGGLGSLSTSPPTTVRSLKLKPPTAFMGLLRRRKRSDYQLNEQYQSPPRRSQSVYYRPRHDIQEDIALADFDYLEELSRDSSFEGPTSNTSIVHADYDDTNLIIEEVSRRKSDERRERSLNKLTRTLGAHPLTILEDRQVTKSPIFDNYSTTSRKNEHLRERGPTTIRKKLSRRHHHHHRQWDSFEIDDVENDSMLSSPITFAPSSMEKNVVSHHDPEPTPTTGIQHHHHTNTSDGFTSSSSTRAEEDSSVQSHSRIIPSPEPSSSSSPSRDMPHLHVSTHTDAVLSNIPYDVSLDMMNEPVAKSDWLVPLNEVVISISRTAAPSKPQSWTGEWNREMKDVIRDLRRL